MLLLQCGVFCVWPPYKVDLEYHEELVISADASSVSEDYEEMLREHDMQHSLDVDLR
jgi:hypothetical protein